MSTIKILHHRNVIGAVEISQEGLFTVFTAACEPIAPKLRLAVFGAEHQAYLGLMLPEADGRLHLRRRLSRLECARLPQPMRYAAPEGERSADAPRAEALPEGWTAAPDGTLRLGGCVAIPLSRVRAPGVEPRLLRTIGGREYLVFSLDW